MISDGLVTRQRQMADRFMPDTLTVYRVQADATPNDTAEESAPPPTLVTGDDGEPWTVRCRYAGAGAPYRATGGQMVVTDSPTVAVPADTDIREDDVLRVVFHINDAIKWVEVVSADGPASYEVQRVLSCRATSPVPGVDP